MSTSRNFTTAGPHLKTRLATVCIMLIIVSFAQVARPQTAEAAAPASASCGVEQNMIVVHPSYNAAPWWRAWLFEWDGSSWGNPIDSVQTNTGSQTWFGLKDRTYYQVRYTERSIWGTDFEQVPVRHLTFDYLATNVLIGRLLLSSNYSWCYT